MFYFIVEIFEILLRIVFQREYFEKYGLSRRGVLRRTIITCFILNALYFVWFLFPFIIGLKVFDIDLFYPEQLTLFSCGAVFWGLYLFFNQEYVSKYSRLIDFHDSVVTDASKYSQEIFEGKFSYLSASDLVLIENASLNFAEDCLVYHLQNEKNFKDSFRKTAAVLFRIKQKNPEVFKDLVYDLEELPKFINRIYFGCAEEIDLRVAYNEMNASEKRLKTFWEHFPKIDKKSKGNAKNDTNVHSSQEERHQQEFSVEYSILQETNDRS